MRYRRLEDLEGVAWTKSELAVLPMLELGLDVCRMAELLGVSGSAVSERVSRMRGKLEAAGYELVRPYRAREMG